MSDIVERLRKCAGEIRRTPIRLDTWIPLQQQAADEIERLRSQLAKTQEEADRRTREVEACYAVQRDLKARLAEADRKLRVYGQHLPNCRSLIYLTSMPPKTQPCDCGLVTPDSASGEGEKC